MNIQRFAALRIGHTTDRTKKNTSSFFSNTTKPNSIQKGQGYSQGNCKSPLDAGQSNNAGQVRANVRPFPDATVGANGPARVSAWDPYAVKSIRSKNGTQHSIQITGTGIPKACTVTCVAMVANIPPEEAINAAKKYANYEEGQSMSMKRTYKTLKGLGIKAKMHWGKPILPNIDYAVIKVYQRMDDVYHAVVYKKHRNGKSYVYDCNMNHPINPNRFVVVEQWIEIKSPKSQGG
jgi:hypothetical protein